MAAQPPSFASVAVPVRNEERTIGACLAAVLAQDYPREAYEILVVDGGSNDRTRAIVAEIAAGADVPVRLLENPRGTTPAALNRALEAARGDFFVRVDGHSEPEPHYVRACVEGALELGAALAGGWVEPAGTSGFGRAVAAAFESPFGMGNAVSWRRPDAPREVASVPCGAYRADLLRAIGGFDEEQLANQDYEANYRLRAAGGRIFILPGVSFRYVPRDSPHALARQFLRYGFYKARTMIKHPSSVRMRHLVPPALVVAGVALLVAAPFSRLASGLLLAGVALYVAGLVVVSALAARRLGRAALHLPLVFATMHLCWGAANAAGLVRWLPRRRSMHAAVEPLSA